MTILRTNTTAGLRIEPDNAGNIVFITGTGNVAMRMESSGLVNMSASRLVIPTGNTTQRPVNPITGSLRFNTQIGVFEAFSGAAWATISSNVYGMNIEYLAVAGGGAGGPGGSGYGGGGGGGGGVLTGNITYTNQTFTVSVGAGGATNTNGSSSNIFVLLPSYEILSLGTTIFLLIS